jgi:N6-adenosine-specific RNA methylase IME4
MTKYKTIVMDPPWEVDSGFAKRLTNTKYYRFGKKLPYETMTDNEILEFPINDFADEECALFIWTIQKKTPFVFKLLEKWGFKFNLILTWKKSSGIGLKGFYRNSETCIYAYRGKMCVDWGKGHYIKTCFEAPVTKNSEKPSIFYESISNRTLEPRIDIFARRRHDGFDAWGDQVEEVKVLKQEVLAKE